MNRRMNRFLWGAATSSFQIEGAVREGGRGRSIWDTFCEKPGAIADGTNGDVACDHYHRYAEDLDLLRWMGVDTYRFSIAWPRIQPTGRGAANADGLDFYSRIVDGLLERGIEPAVTLYHLDLPQALEEEGGWRERTIVDRFVEYTDLVSRALGDRVSLWITHNEPWCVAHLGHATGEQAPGIKDVGTSLAVAHHVLLSHGAAVPVLRRNVANSRVGITLNLCPAFPASESAADARATHAFDGFFNRWYLDPLYGRGYPIDKIHDYQASGDLPDGAIPFLQDGDLATIATPTDFLGINYYSRAILRDDNAQDNLPVTLESTGNVTDMGWEVHADSLRLLLHRLDRDYRPPSMYITENGAAYPTLPDADGRVRDVEREAYLRAHIDAVEQARREGVPVDGYFAWSLLDNFEWAFGYEKRFGLVYVDYETQARIPKDSAHWYRGRIAASVRSARTYEAS